MNHLGASDSMTTMWSELPVDMLYDLEGQLASCPSSSLFQSDSRTSTEESLFQPLGSQSSLFLERSNSFASFPLENTCNFTSLFNSNSFSLNAPLKREDSFKNLFTQKFPQQSCAQSFTQISPPHSMNNSSNESLLFGPGSLPLNAQPSLGVSFTPQSHPQAQGQWHPGSPIIPIRTSPQTTNELIIIDQSDDVQPVNSTAPVKVLRLSFKELARYEAQNAPSEINQDIIPLSLEEKQQMNNISKLINQIKQLQQKQEQQIAELKYVQIHLLRTNDRSNLNRLKEAQSNTLKQISLGIHRLSDILKIVVLEGEVLNATRILLHQLQLQACYIELLQQEIVQFELPGPTMSVAKLVITEQSLPHVMFKGKVMDVPYSVSMLTGTLESFTSISNIEGKLITEGLNFKAKNPIENNISQLDGFQKQATFNGIKINVSSRMCMISLKFIMQVTSENRTITVESIPSYPFIVITNESQWVEAAAKLVMMDGFGGLPQVPWPQFANVLHKHFLSATRQDLAMPERPLHFYEMRYFHCRINGGTSVVTQQQASQFFSWFGNVERTIRFKRHVFTLWCQGLIYGFFTKDYCERALSTQGVGTFLVRFSESQPGLFAVAYVTDDPEERIKHYLVKAEDTGTNKALPDFIRDSDPFQFVLKIEPGTGKLTRLEKDFAFGKFYSKRKQTVTEGYVDVL